MRVLIDAVHPADVWTLGAVEDRLVDDGVETLWVTRPGKQAVVELIEARGVDHVHGPRAGTSMPALALELIRRDLTVLRAVRRFRPDVILTRSPAGVHVGRLTRTPVMYDTDDGHVAGMLFYIAGPFANIIASPTATTKSYGRQHRRYRGYKELAYLHPDRFTPDASIRDELGLDSTERFSVVRLTSFTASHDVSEAGLTGAQVERVIAALEPHGAVFISAEGDVPAHHAHRLLDVAIHRFHHVLAAASLVVGDSQTVCSEAAVLGTPSLRYNTWAGRHPYQVELEERWGLTRAFALDEAPAFFDELDRVLDDLDATAALQTARRAEMLDWCGDPVDDLVRWTYELAGRSESGSDDR